MQTASEIFAALTTARIAKHGICQIASTCELPSKQWVDYENLDQAKKGVGETAHEAAKNIHTAHATLQTSYSELRETYNNIVGTTINRTPLREIQSYLASMAKASGLSTAEHEIWGTPISSQQQDLLKKLQDNPDLDTLKTGKQLLTAIQYKNDNSEIRSLYIKVLQSMFHQEPMSLTSVEKLMLQQNLDIENETLNESLKNLKTQIRENQSAEEADLNQKQSKIDAAIEKLQKIEQQLQSKEENIKKRREKIDADTKALEQKQAELQAKANEVKKIEAPISTWASLLK